MNPSITVYEYDKTGLYTGETTAEPSPREEGVWLIPANATPLEPPVTGEHECAVFRNGLSVRRIWYLISPKPLGLQGRAPSGTFIPPMEMKP